MNEWQSAIKISLACLLVIGLIMVGISFALSGEAVKEVTVSRFDAPSTADELYRFNGKYLDRESAFNLACNCINQPVTLKIHSQAYGLKTVNPASPKVRKEIDTFVDRDRFKVSITEISGKITVSLEG